jgi:hypothetical protein
MHRLGVAAYGMIPLANSLVMYAAIISTRAPIFGRISFFMRAAAHLA